MRALLFVALVACAYALETQNVKSGTKDGHSSYQYRGGDINRYYGENNTHNNGAGYNRGAANFEVGVCYMEVPTASLAPLHGPVEKGSRPDLSRIRVCCKGYKRNPYNFHICDPECTTDCVNALCTAPDTCSCFPDHVKNLAGICVATCPISCQNGHCSGSECLCNEGYKLDRDGRFCVPSCAAECNRIGNCTAPNTCTCTQGEYNPICHSIPQSPGSGQHPLPGHPQHGTNKPPQGDTFYVNPNNPSYPYPYNQNKNNTLVPVPNQSHSPTTINPNYPVNPNYSSGNQGPHSTYPYHQSGYPQGSNQPHPSEFYIYNNSDSSTTTTISTYPQRQGAYPYPSYPHPGQQNSPYGQQSHGINSYDQNSYQTQDLSSSPSCSGPCINGACDESNICKCNPGYVIDENDTTGRRCRPHCPAGCPNGYCTLPYSCACDEGYYKDTVKGRAHCIKRIRR